MARAPEPRVRAPDFAPEHTEDPSGERRISDIAARILVLWAIVLDIGDYFGLGEIWVTKLLCVVTIDIYLLYKGFTPLRMFGAQLVGVVPGVGTVLPEYIAGVLFTIAQDRSELVAAAAKRLPAPKPGGRVAGSAGQAASRIRVQAQKAIETVERGARKVQKVQQSLDRIPGPVRSIPGMGAPDSARGLRSSPQISLPPRNQTSTLSPGGFLSSKEGDLPFPDTYYRYERELLPELDDLTADIDVTGERATRAAAQGPNGPANPNQV